jgi:hypothetical protein
VVTALFRFALGRKYLPKDAIEENQIPKLVEETSRLRKERSITAKFVWKHNGLRHSFCSYRLASIKNATQVALAAGNSPQMIFAHYRQVVTESEEAKWFSVFPQPALNIVRMN